MALVGAVSSFAQANIDPSGVFVFTDKDGNVYDDGATIECTAGEYDDYDTYQIPSGLYVKQTSYAASFGVGMKMSITQLNNGSLNVCFPQSCQSFKKTGTADLGKNTLSGTVGYMEDTKLASFMTEWIPESETAYGQCSATFTLTTLNKKSFSEYTYLGESRKITVNFVLKDPTAINGVKDNGSATVVARYAADGSLLSAPAKGINILKLSDGRTVKTTVK